MREMIKRGKSYSCHHWSDTIRGSQESRLCADRRFHPQMRHQAGPQYMRVKRVDEEDASQYVECFEVEVMLRVVSSWATM